jgi:hypothetical protein
MSPENLETIYVSLLEEGTPVARPTTGERIRGNTFRLRPTTDYDPEDEVWEFLPGEIVECREVETEGRTILHAFRMALDP